MVNWNIIPIDIALSWALVLTTIEPSNAWKPLTIRDKRESALC